MHDYPILPVCDPWTKPPSCILTQGLALCSIETPYSRECERLRSSRCIESAPAEFDACSWDFTTGRFRYSPKTFQAESRKPGVLSGLMTIQVEYRIVFKGSRIAESRHERWNRRRKIIARIPAVLVPDVLSQRAAYDPLRHIPDWNLLHHVKRFVVDNHRGVVAGHCDIQILPVRRDR